MKQISFRKMSSKPCGICHNVNHKGYLSAKAVKEHACVEKKCPLLQRLEHDYWKQIERKYLEKRYVKLSLRHGRVNFKDDAWKQAKSMLLDDLRMEVIGMNEREEEV